MKRIIKCGTAFLLALVLCLCLLPTTAFAASKQVYIWNFPLSDDTLKSDGNWGHGVLNLRFGYRVSATSYTQFRCLGSWQGEVAYCIEPGAPQKNYDSLTDHDDTWWDHLTLPDGHPLTPREVQRLIGRIMSYGYHGAIGGGWWADVEATAEKMAWAYATQVLIWEVVAGERDSSFRHIDVKSMGYNEALERVDATHPLRGKILSYYDSIVDAAYHVMENGKEWYYKTTPGEELLGAARMLRKYLKDTERSTGKFISLYSQAQPITPEEYQHLIHLRMENG